MTHLMAGILLLAEENRGPDYGKASPVGLLVVVLLLLGVFVLMWSMNRHLKRVPTSFDPPGSAAGTPPGDAAPDAEAPPRESSG